MRAHPCITAITRSGTAGNFIRKRAQWDSRASSRKRADAAYAPGNRGLWVKVKCLHREEFVVVGWTDPEGTRPRLGALLLAYYDPDGKLVYAGRAGTGIKQAELERLWRRLQPLATSKMPLAVPPPRDSRFGSPLVLSRVHWVRPELVAEVKYLTWTDDNLLRQVVYEGLREDKPASRGPPRSAASESARCGKRARPVATRAQLNVPAGAAVKIIAGPVVAPGQIDQLTVEETSPNVGSVPWRRAACWRARPGQKEKIIGPGVPKFCTPAHRPSPAARLTKRSQGSGREETPMSGRKSHLHGHAASC